MKKLFKVSVGGKTQFFDNKMDAKAFRGDPKTGATVAKGPDHMGIHGSKGRPSRANK